MAETLLTAKSSGQLSGYNRCKKERSFPWIMKEDVPIVNKIAAEKSVLLNAMFSDERQELLAAKRINDSDKITDLSKKILSKIKIELDTAYDEKGVIFDLETQKEAIITMSAAIIGRYVINEERTPISNSLTGRVQFNLPELDDIISVKPDLTYYTTTNGIDTIECVIIKTGKASNFTQNGKKRDGSVENSIELYLLWCYARLLAKPGRKTIVKASYYFLKGKDDYVRGKGLSEINYWDLKQAVFTLEDSVIKNKNGAYKMSYTDASFKEQLIEFNKGSEPEECSKEDCDKCPIKPFCQYNVSPVFVVKAPKTSKMRAIDFSKAQLDVINFRNGYAVVNAGAGAGKTAVVTYWVETYAEEGGKEEDVLCITFTKNGAEEMRQRIAATLIDNGMEDEWDANKIKICTFNSFCNDIVQSEYDKLGFSTPPDLIEEAERAQIIAALEDKYQFDGIDKARFNEESFGIYCANGLETVCKAFEIIKKNKLSAGDEETLKKLLEQKYWTAMNNSFTCLTQLLEAYNEYDKLMRLNNKIEYADQELLLFELLQQDPYYLESFGYKHIIVDEFQDTSSQQMEILKQLTDTPDFESILVVGDDSQAIYGFLGTGPEHLINFFDEIEAPEDQRFIFNLIDNYRCTPEIIELANKENEMNKHRVEKDLIAHRKSLNIPVRTKGFYDVDAEYDYIVEEIKEQLKKGKNPEDIAVLGRNKNILNKIGEKLSAEHIPCVSMSPENVLENSKVIAAIELAKAIDNPTLSRSVMVYLNCKYENTLLELTPNEIRTEVNNFTNRLQVIRNMKEKEKIAEFMSLLDDINYDGDELYESFIESLKFRPTFKKQLEYIRMTEKYGKKQTYTRERDYPGVVLTTMHSSKGLEWETVIMTMDGIDDEKYHKYSSKHEKEIEEIRRLIFVSMTRARDELIITGLFNLTARSKIQNGFFKEIWYNLGMEEQYKSLCIDPKAEVKKAEAEIQKAEEKRAAAERKARLLEEANASELTKCEGVLNPLPDDVLPEKEYSGLAV